MTYYNGGDRDELYEFPARQYQLGNYSLVRFTAVLSNMGYTAEEIAQIEKQYRPLPEEDMEP